MPINLKDFVSKDVIERFRIHTAWVLPDGRIAATNGWAAVVVDAEYADYESPIEQESVGKRPSVLVVFEKIEDVKEWSDKLPDYPECDRCHGLGQTVEVCDDCHGMKTLECDLGHSHQCESCDAKGFATTRCDACAVMFGAKKITRLNANKIAALPGVVWGEDSKCRTEAVFFKFTGGIGVCMPLDINRGRG